MVHSHTIPLAMVCSVCLVCALTIAIEVCACSIVAAYTASKALNLKVPGISERLPTPFPTPYFWCSYFWNFGVFILALYSLDTFYSHR